MMPVSILFGLMLLAAVANAACTGRPRRDGRCGSPEFGDARCQRGYCCSQYNWCGQTPAHCNPDICAPAPPSPPTQTKQRPRAEREASPSSDRSSSDVEREPSPQRSSGDSAEETDSESLQISQKVSQEHSIASISAEPEQSQVFTDAIDDEPEQDPPKEQGLTSADAMSSKPEEGRSTPSREKVGASADVFSENPERSPPTSSKEEGVAFADAVNAKPEEGRLSPSKGNVGASADFVSEQDPPVSSKEQGVASGAIISHEPEQDPPAPFKDQGIASANILNAEQDPPTSSKEQSASSASAEHGQDPLHQQGQGPSDVSDAQPKEPVSRDPISTFALSSGGPRVLISSLSASDLQSYRDAWARITAGQLNSIYQEIARDHGVPNYYCPHGNQKFLPWHRWYMNRIEDALGVPLAYWDWTQEGIPAAYSDQTYVNSSGETVPNPLYSNWLISGQPSSRNPDLHPDRFRALLAFAQSQTDFASFTTNLESVHDNVHGAIGNTMSMVSIASFDPIFFAHHCFVDFQWWIWQLVHPDAVYNSDALGPMEDSTGTFLGSTMIADQSRWRRGRSADQFPRALTSSAFSEPQLFLILKNVPSMQAPTDISVYVDDIFVASGAGFGMQGMKRHIQKDCILHVEQGNAEKIWVENDIELDAIPDRATVWWTKNGQKIKQLEGVSIELGWLK